MHAYRCGQDCEPCGRCGKLSRRRFLRQMACGAVALSGVGAFASACAPLTQDGADAPPTTDATGEALSSYLLPTEADLWRPPKAHTGDLPTGEGEVRIDGLGTFSFDAGQVVTVRPDVFQPSHFSLFDILVHLHDRGDIALDYHFDKEMSTYVIDAINDQGPWWYDAYYSHGWSELNVFRMDSYPYKNGTRFRLFPEREQRVEAIHLTFRDEVERLARNGGQIVIPDLVIDSPYGNWGFQDVVVTSHDIRTDVLQPGVVTALDALLSLAEQGELRNLKLTWYERIAGADPVDSYWLEQVDEAVAVGGCGFVYETGPRAFPGFRGSHIHIPADVRATVSPEYALWFWICLGRGR